MTKLDLLRRIVLCGILASLSCAAPAEDDQQAELEQLKSSISSLEKKLHNQGQEKNDLEQQLKLIELESIEVNTSIRKLRHQIASLKKQLVTLTEKKQLLELRISNQSLAIAEELRSAHKIGSEEPIKLLLNQENPQQMARIFKYYDYFIEARSKKIQQFKTNIDDLTVLVKNISKTKITLAKSKKNLEVDRRKLANNVAERTKMLNKVQSALLSGEDKLATLQKQRNELENLISEVKLVAKKVTPPKDYPSFAASKGKLIWPVKGSITHRFGSQRSDYLRWAGWLIDVPNGSIVSSVHHGRVVFSNYLRGFGLLIIVDHGGDFMSLYAHNQELLRDTGDWVQSGETVSRAGNTGGLIKPAVYFEIRKKGIPIDPKHWLSKNSKR